MKVDFFIVGAPKAGTTSLYYYLNEHPEIEMSTQKETDFFSDSAIQKLISTKVSQFDTFINSVIKNFIYILVH